MTKTRSPKELAHNRNEAALKILEELGAAAVLGNLGTVPALIATAATRPRDAGGNEDKIARELRRLAAAIAACTSYRRTARGRIAARLVAGVSGGTAPHVAADGGVCWGPLLTPNDPNVLHKGGWRTVGVHDFELLAQALRTTRAGGRLSALAIVVEACGLALPVEPFRPIKRASLPALQRVTEPQRELPAIQASPTATEPQLLLPGFAPLTNDGAASWLLALYDQAGGQSMRQGRGAPWDLRLFVAALLHVPIEARTGARVQLPFRLPEIVSWLHPDGWENRRRDWNKLPGGTGADRSAMCANAMHASEQRQDLDRTASDGARGDHPQRVEPRGGGDVYGENTGPGSPRRTDRVAAPMPVRQGIGRALSGLLVRMHVARQFGATRPTAHAADCGASDRGRR